MTAAPAREYLSAVTADTSFIEFLNSGLDAAAAHVADMTAAPPDEWEAWLGRQPEALTWHFCTALLERAHAALDRDPRHALALTTFVLAHAADVEVPADADFVRGRLQGRAWKEHGNALRTLVDNHAALEAFRRAADLFRADPLARVEQVAAERGVALVLADLGQPHEALAILRAGAEELRLHRDRPGVVRSQLYEGAVLYHLLRYEEAAAVWERALETANELGDEKTAARLHNNLGSCARLLQDRAASIRHLLHAQTFFETHGMVTERGRAAEGLAELVADAGDVERAIAEMEAVRSAWLGQGLEMDAAGVELDIMELLVLAGRGGEVSARVASLVERFADAGVVREAMRACALLQDDEAQRALTPEQKRSVAAAVKKVRDARA